MSLIFPITPCQCKGYPDHYINILISSLDCLSAFPVLFYFKNLQPQSIFYILLNLFICHAKRYDLFSTLSSPIIVSCNKKSINSFKLANFPLHPYIFNLLAASTQFTVSPSRSILWHPIIPHSRFPYIPLACHF